MRIATRLSLWLGVTVCLTVGLHAVWNAYQVIEMVRTEQERDLRVEAELLATALAPALREDGFISAGRVVTEVRTELPGGARWWRPTLEPPANFAGSPKDWRQLISERASFYRMTDDAHAYFVPVMVNETVRGVLMLRRTSERRDAMLRAMLIERGLLALLVILGVLLVVRISVRRLVGRPLLALGALSERIGKGDFSGRAAGTKGELGTFARHMNHMSERLEESQAALESEMQRRIATMDELRHAERLKTVGQLASGTAHELGTPLNVITGRARMIARGIVTGDALVESAEVIEAQGKRMTTLIKGLLRFARQQPSPDTQVDLCVVAAQCKTLLDPLLKKRNVELDLDVPSKPLCIQGDAGQLEQIIANMLQNAAHAMPDGGRVRMRVALTQDAQRPEGDAAEGAYLCLSVADEGQGMPPEVLSRIFDPFFTTKPVGEGTGLGLSIAYGIVRDHGGWITVDSVVDTGTTFRIYLPHSATA